MSELHEDVCGSHIGGRALSLKIIRAGYYWLTMKEDGGKYVHQCEQCQKHVIGTMHQLRSCDRFTTHGLSTRGEYTFWSLSLWHMPDEISHRRQEYFTEWIEVEPIAQITAHKVQHFVWKNIVCRFGIPRHLVSNNGT